MDFSTGDKTFLEVMGNGLRYGIPRYQRDYGWDVDQWLDLWEDLRDACADGGESHYMGYLVLQRSRDGSRLAVIDGQQRLTTLSLLVLAGIREIRRLGEDGRLPADQTQRRVEALRQAYLATTDPVDLKVAHKLTLNRNNNAYFRHIARLETPPQRRIRASERLLWKACRFFEERLAEEVQTQEGIASLLDKMAKRLFFTTITVGDELDAYRVFETLNARAVRLSTPDLLKNYVFATLDREGLHDEALDELDRRWSGLGHQLGRIDFTAFVLAEWNRRNPPARKSDLYRRIRDTVTSPGDATAYLRELERGVEVYAALHDPADEHWRADPAAVRLHLKGLALFQVKQPFGLLMTVRERGSGSEFERVLRWVYAFAMRYRAVCGLPHQAEIGMYSRAAQACVAGQGVAAVKRELEKLCPGDEAFAAAFQRHAAHASFSTKRPRFLLARLAETLAGDRTPVHEEDLTLEHILPATPDGAWRKAFGPHADEDADRLGNMALVSPALNKDLGRRPFEQKEPLLAGSPLALNRLQAESWDHEAVEARQARLARLACQAWRIDPA